MKLEEIFRTTHYDYERKLLFNYIILSNFNLTKIYCVIIMGRGRNLQIFVLINMV
jgi:hypothetical protein